MGINGRLSNYLFFLLSLIFFLSIFFQTQKGLTFLKSTSSTFNSFFANLFHSIKKEVNGFFLNFKSVRELQKEKEDLERINLSLKAQVFNLENEVRKYRKLMDFPPNSEFDFLVAEIVGWDITNPYIGLFINKGEKEGVKIYSPVLDRWFNLVGRVLRVSGDSAEVILLTNADFSASVKLKDGVYGILSGENSPLCTLNYITDPSSVNPGMEVSTSGLDRIFPRGIKVGKIEKVVSHNGGLKTFYLKPYTDLKSIDFVIVLKK